MLQKLLDWVRDNRARFVKWGEVLANVFKTVVSGIKRVLEFAKSLSTTLMGFISRIFGDSISSFEELFNLLTFKFATMIEFIRILFTPLKRFIQPIIDLVGDTLVGAFQIVMSLIEGFITGFGKMEPVIEDVVGLIQDIVKFLTTANEKGDSIKNIFGTIGEIIGITVRAAIETVVSLFKGFLRGVENIATPLQGIADRIKEFVTNLTTVTEKGNSIQTIFGKIGEIFGRIVTWVTEMTESFLTGFIPAIKNISDPISDIVDKFSTIFSKIFDSDESMKSWKSTFEDLGRFLGDVLIKALELVADVLDGIITAIEVIKQLISGEISVSDALFGDITTDESGNVQVDGKSFGKAFLDNFTNVFTAPIEFFRNLRDRKNEDEDVPISSLPESSLPTNQSTSSTTTNDIKIDMSGLNINVNEGTEEEGVRIGEGLVQGMRNEFNRTFEAQGIG